VKPRPLTERLGVLLGLAVVMATLAGAVAGPVRGLLAGPLGNNLAAAVGAGTAGLVVYGLAEGIAWMDGRRRAR
jgi:uncharacterized protein involved in cysteine biosynthesis